MKPITMKKITILSVLLSLSALTYAQKSALFKFKYAPDRTYTMNSKMDMATEMDLKSDSTNQVTNTSGSKLKVHMDINELMGASAKTAKAIAKSLPFTLSCNNYSISQKVNINGKENTLTGGNTIVGKILNGSIDKNGKMSTDTVVNGVPISVEVKSGSAALLREMRPQTMNFPDKQMKIGDTFTQEEPMTDINVPDMGITKQVNVKVTYKLTAIKGNLAYFDTASTFNMDINEHDTRRTITGKGDGSGTGKMIYNIADNYPQSKVNDINVAFNIEGHSTKPSTLKASMKIKRSTAVEYLVSVN
ncbi:hypothetical protein [Mucilaginibacter sp. UYCu711]|uniref:hypothetical protein n=1 Tax=Mucilaginibacter sp. UYCu711 TaxID=3156339 RepID=UPI003D22CA4C